jgi:hypothetical protein
MNLTGIHGPVVTNGFIHKDICTWETKEKFNSMLKLNRTDRARSMEAFLKDVHEVEEEVGIDI